MAIDFGLYTALRGREDFAQKRQDAAAQEHYLGLQDQMANQKLVEEKQSQQGILDYLDQMSKFDILPQDMDRLKNHETTLRGKIISGLKESGGDAKKYLLSGGNVDLKNYQNGLMSGNDHLGSSPYKDALYNKHITALAQTDASHGMQARPIPMLDPETGKMVNNMPVSRQLELLGKGKLKQLTYGGAVKPADITDTLKFLTKTIGDQRNPYRAVQIEPQHIMQTALSAGKEPWQAQQLADQYAQMVKQTGKPYYFDRKFMDGRDMYYRMKAKMLTQPPLLKSQYLDIANGNGVVPRGAHGNPVAGGSPFATGTDYEGKPFTMYQNNIGDKFNHFATNAGLQIHRNSKGNLEYHFQGNPVFNEQTLKVPGSQANQAYGLSMKDHKLIPINDGDVDTVDPQHVIYIHKNGQVIPGFRATIHVHDGMPFMGGSHVETFIPADVSLDAGQKFDAMEKGNLKSGSQLQGLGYSSKQSDLGAQQGYQAAQDETGAQNVTPDDEEELY